MAEAKGPGPKGRGEAKGPKGPVSQDKAFWHLGQTPSPTTSGWRTQQRGHLGWWLGVTLAVRGVPSGPSVSLTALTIKSSAKLSWAARIRYSSPEAVTSN